MDMPMPAGNAPDAPSPVGQQIADAAKQLPVDDLAALINGISPDALEVMEKIPELAAFADFVENAGNQQDEDDKQENGAAPGKPGLAVIIGVGKAPRDDVSRAMAQHRVR